MRPSFQLLAQALNMNQELLDRVLQSPRLPSLPAVALDVIDLVQQENVNIREIAETIQNDPALSSRILKTVNSSFYGQRHAVSTISHALVVLGLNSVKTLALGFSLVPNLSREGGDGFDHLAFWRRSLYTAAAARQLAQTLANPQHEEIFLGGLMQDLGMMMLTQVLGQEYGELIAQTQGDHRLLSELEYEKYGTDHAQLGADLAEHWHLPPELVLPIRYHERPDQAPEEIQQMAKCVYVGNSVADVFAAEDPGPSLARYLKEAENQLGIGRDQSQSLLQDIHRGSVEMRRLFDLPTGELGNADDILARANEALLNISLQSQQQAAQAEEQNQQLSREVSTDSLTGVANRRRFNEYVQQSFDEVTRTGNPLSVMFLDTDHFKKFNDTYGHQVGDMVLVEQAKTLEKVTGELGLVCRYGGEEFAIILPNMDRVTATRQAEETRKAIEQIELTNEDGEVLHITASIGVATYTGDFFTKAELLVKAADQAVYAAKRSGRNCVRVFAPRVKNAA